MRNAEYISVVAKESARILLRTEKQESIVSYKPTAIYPYTNTAPASEKAVLALPPTHPPSLLPHLSSPLFVGVIQN